MGEGVYLSRPGERKALAVVPAGSPKGDKMLEFLRDLWGFMRTRKKYWLLPIIITLLFFGVLIVFTSGSAIAPFIYTIF